MQTYGLTEIKSRGLGTSAAKAGGCRGRDICARIVFGGVALHLRLHGLRRFHSLTARCEKIGP